MQNEKGYLIKRIIENLSFEIYRSIPLLFYLDKNIFIIFLKKIFLIFKPQI